MPGDFIEAFQNKIKLRYNWNIVESGIKHHNPDPHRNQISPKNKAKLYWHAMIGEKAYIQSEW